MSAAFVVVGQNPYDPAFAFDLETTLVIGEGVGKDLIVACRLPARSQEAVLLQSYAGSNCDNDNQS